MRAELDPLRYGHLALVAQAALQLLWHGGAAVASRGASLVITLLPLAPALWIARRNLRRGVLIGGIASLLYFAHGVSTAWSDPAARGPALAETVLALLVIGTLAGDLRSRRRGRAG